jgi:hypothetical protein
MTHTSQLTGKQVAQRVTEVATLAEQLYVQCQRLGREIVELRSYYNNNDSDVALALGLANEVWIDARDFANAFAGQYPNFVNGLAVNQTDRLDDILRWTP